jgi:hypothetical protein
VEAASCINPPPAPFRSPAVLNHLRCARTRAGKFAALAAASCTLASELQTSRSFYSVVEWWYGRMKVHGRDAACVIVALNEERHRHQLSYRVFEYRAVCVLKPLWSEAGVAKRQQTRTMWVSSSTKCEWRKPFLQDWFLDRQNINWRRIICCACVQNTPTFNKYPRVITDSFETGVRSGKRNRFDIYNACMCVNGVATSSNLAPQPFLYLLCIPVHVIR